MQDTDYLHVLRQYELEVALSAFPDAGGIGTKTKVLEIGAGTGHQAKLLHERGYLVEAIDVESSAYKMQRVFPVVEYDGKVIPVPSESVGVVYSSNVLEHVIDLDNFLDETARALAHRAVAIHILPSSAWRLWTIVGHYGWLIKKVLARVFRTRTCSDAALPKTPSTRNEFVDALFPSRHGERGNVMSEIYLYSRAWWIRKFEMHGFRIVADYPTGLFYTGACVFGEHLSIIQRSRIARCLGSACRIYVLQRL